VEALTDEWERLEAEILRRAKLEAPRRATLAELRKALPPKSALIDFVEYTRTDAATFVEQRCLAAFIISGDKTFRRIELGPVVELTNAYHSWRAAAEPYSNALAAAEQKRSGRKIEPR